MVKRISETPDKWISEKRDIQMKPWKWIQERLINSKRMFLSHYSWLDRIEFQNYGIPGFHKNQWVRKLCLTIIACNPFISHNQPNDQRVLIAHPSLSDGFHFQRSNFSLNFCGWSCPPWFIVAIISMLWLVYQRSCLLKLSDFWFMCKPIISYGMLPKISFSSFWQSNR